VTSRRAGAPRHWQLHTFDVALLRSHGASFAALRLPAALAAIALACGPIAALVLHLRRKPMGVVLTLALTSATFLIAAHIALVRFAPMLSSRDFAVAIEQMENSDKIARDSEVMIYGDQAFGSSIPFYLGRHVQLVDGRSTSMLFAARLRMLRRSSNEGATAGGVGTGAEKNSLRSARAARCGDRILGARQILVAETSGKALYTDRPLDAGAPR